MKETNKNLEVVLKSAIKESLRNYQLANDGSFLGDLYLHYDTENQTVRFFDDVERALLAINLSDNDVVLEFDSLKEVKIAAKSALKELEKEAVFEESFIHKPFTVNLIDSDFIILDELIFIDDETLKLDEDFWGGADKELDDFLKNLLK